MLHQARHGQGPFKQGYTLIEVIAAVAIMAVVLSMVLGSYSARINRAKLDQTVQEMTSLAQASVDFYNSKGIWPASPADLVPTYMYTAITSSIFGKIYQISHFNNTVTISTAVPLGLAKNYTQGSLLQVLTGTLNDTLLITQRPSNEFSGRLEYENKHTYQQ
jgi:prepilin-type N-terminal cleavage/methylation domain-containing protein